MTYGEFDQIKNFMAPLAAKAKGAFDLKNDGAVFSCAPELEWVISTDTLIADVHFFADDRPEDIATKILGVNLSDLAAMGATPRYYTLNASYPKNIAPEWIARFAGQLDNLQKHYQFFLLGGDTTATPGPLCFSLTALGTVPKGRSLQRDTAQIGDLIFVTGTIGDAALGLIERRKTASLHPQLIDRYLRPQPRTTVGPALLNYATACLDISDGLLGDLGHILTHSQCGAIIEQNKIPLSREAKHILQEDHKTYDIILNGGDDYELLFTAPAQYISHIDEISLQSGVQITQIGQIKQGKTLTCLSPNGQEMQITQKSYTHF